VKQSKGVGPRTIASAAAARVMSEMCVLDVSVGVGGAKGGVKRQSSKLVHRTKVAPSAKKCIIPTFGALAALSTDGVRNLRRMTRRPRFNQGRILGAHQRSLTVDLLLHRGRSLPPKLLFGLCLLQASLGLRQVAFGFGKC
jgi:hypothetical protein